MITYIIFIIGFVLLIKGADFLIEGSSSIAKGLNISELVIGLTVVAFGTSSPELFVNILASVKGSAGIAIGNVLGSNIANTFLILGISSLIYPLTVSKGTVWKEIPFSLMAALVLGILVNDILIDMAGSSALNRIDGIILLFFFIIFIYYSFTIAKGIEGMEEHIPKGERNIVKSVFFIIIGLIGLSLGGKWIVETAIKIAKQYGVNESLIGLTIVSIGTSLPELATSVVAAYKRNVEIAVGNIVGSNIFNIFFVLGISSIIKPIPFSSENNLDIIVVIFASLLLFLSMFTGRRRTLDRWEGGIFFLLYISYIIILVINNVG